jgi:hypothetical protein
MTEIAEADAIADGQSLEQRAAALVNPVSGLANDYLNVFNELLMLVENLPSMPDLIDDVLAWRPVSYEAYFRGSSLPGRQQALEAYERLDSGLRREFEDIVADLDRCATGSVAAIRLRIKKRRDRNPEALAALCAKASETMRDILGRAANIVDYGASQAEENAQRRADRLLAVRIQALRDLQDFHNRPRFARG